MLWSQESCHRKSNMVFLRSVHDLYSNSWIRLLVTAIDVSTTSAEAKWKALLARWCATFGLLFFHAHHYLSYRSPHSQWWLLRHHRWLGQSSLHSWQEYCSVGVLCCLGSGAARRVGTSQFEICVAFKTRKKCGRWDFPLRLRLSFGVVARLPESTPATRMHQLRRLWVQQWGNFICCFPCWLQRTWVHHVT